MKNTTYFSRNILLPALYACIVLALGACTKEETDLHYLRLPEDTYTVGAEGSESLTIEVSSNPAWSFVVEQGDWITEVSHDAGSLVLKVSPNTFRTERSGVIAFSTGNGLTGNVKITQMAAGYDLPVLRTIDDFTPAEMSPGGIYIAGIKQQVQIDDSYEYTPTLIEVATGKRITMPVSTESLQVMAVTDQGVIFCAYGDMSTVCYNPDGSTFVPEFPSEYSYCNIQSTSADGKVWIGYANHKATRMFHPFKWVDGTAQRLESPELNNLGQTVQIGVIARGCSADGSVIYGSIWDNTKGPVYWSKDGKVHRIGDELVEEKTGTVYNAMFGQDVQIRYYWTLVLYSEKNNISPDGKYIGASYTKSFIENKTLKNNKVPVVLDTETGVLTVTENFPTDVGVTAIGASGTILGGTPSNGSTGGMVGGISGTAVSTQEWVRSQFGITVDKDFFVQDISPDGKTVLGAFPARTLLGVSYRYIYITDNRK